MATTGWCRFDAETQTVINRLSGQRIRFECAASDPPFTRLRFTYSDHQVRYPVLVTARYDPFGPGGFDTPDGRRHALMWSIDHVASAGEWGHSSDTATGDAPYGLWRRVNDCLFDALSCWPKTEATGLAPGTIDAWGGWWNGEWSSRLRVRCGAHGSAPNPLEDGIVPYLVPLDAKPLSWRFVDAPRATPGVTLTGVREIASGRRFLPRGAPLAGFETAIPHLLRSDGRAVMFPYRVHSHFDRDGDYQADARYFYADEDVFFVIGGHSFSHWRGTRGLWVLDLDELYEFGVRPQPGSWPGDPDLTADLARARQIYEWRGPTLQPLPRLAQRLATSLIDGWLAWGDSPLRLLDDPEQLAWLAGQGAPGPIPPQAESGFALNAKGEVWVEGGYRDGRFLGRRFMARLAQDGEIEVGNPQPWHWPA